MKRLFCEGRKEWVKETREELVRQKLLYYLTNNLLYPADGMVLEKALSQLPHLKLAQESLPDRRIDIACYAKNIHKEHSLYPLLLIECKSIKLTDTMMLQLCGYNYYVKAYFLALVNQDEVRFQYHDPSKATSCLLSYIPSYQQLISSLSS